MKKTFRITRRKDFVDLTLDDEISVPNVQLAPTQTIAQNAPVQAVVQVSDAKEDLPQDITQDTTDRVSLANVSSEGDAPLEIEETREMGPKMSGGNSDIPPQAPEAMRVVSSGAEMMSKSCEMPIDIARDLENRGTKRSAEDSEEQRKKKFPTVNSAFDSEIGAMLATMTRGIPRAHTNICDEMALYSDEGEYATTETYTGANRKEPTPLASFGRKIHERGIPVLRLTNKEKESKMRELTIKMAELSRQVIRVDENGAHFDEIDEQMQETMMQIDLIEKTESRDDVDSSDYEDERSDDDKRFVPEESDGVFYHKEVESQEETVGDIMEESQDSSEVHENAPLVVEEFAPVVKKIAPIVEEIAPVAEKTTVATPKRKRASNNKKDGLITFEFEDVTEEDELLKKSYHGYQVPRDLKYKMHPYLSKDGTRYAALGPMSFSTTYLKMIQAMAMMTRDFERIRILLPVATMKSKKQRNQEYILYPMIERHIARSNLEAPCNQELLYSEYQLLSVLSENEHLCPSLGDLAMEAWKALTWMRVLHSSRGTYNDMYLGLGAEVDGDTICWMIIWPGTVNPKRTAPEMKGLHNPDFVSMTSLEDQGRALLYKCIWPESRAEPLGEPYQKILESMMETMSISPRTFDPERHFIEGCNPHKTEKVEALVRESSFGKALIACKQFDEKKKTEHFWISRALTIAYIHDMYSNDDEWKSLARDRREAKNPTEREERMARESREKEEKIRLGKERKALEAAERRAEKKRELQEARKYERELEKQQALEEREHLRKMNQQRKMKEKENEERQGQMRVEEESESSEDEDFDDKPDESNAGDDDDSSEGDSERGDSEREDSEGEDSE